MAIAESLRYSAETICMGFHSMIITLIYQGEYISENQTLTNGK